MAWNTGDLCEGGRCRQRGEGGTEEGTENRDVSDVSDIEEITTHVANELISWNGQKANDMNEEIIEDGYDVKEEITENVIVDNFKPTETIPQFKYTTIRDDRSEPTPRMSISGS